MTCSDCIHYRVCENAYCWIDPNDSNKKTTCFQFKPKSHFIELPCAVGDTVYVIGNVTQEIVSLTVLGVWKIASGFQIITNQGLLLTEYYSTKEEAEKSLKEKQQ